MATIKKFNEDSEALRFENEFLKAKISAEYGTVHAHIIGDAPPELENEFLNNVIRFEETMKNAQRVLVYDFIGRPEFMKEQELTDEQLVIELERVNDMLDKNDIAYCNLRDVEDRLLYKFVTEELFQATIPDKRIPGMVSQFIYENFHPDHEEDTGLRCEEFLEMFFSDEYHQRVPDFFMEELRNFVDLNDFHDSFHEFRNLEFEILPSEVGPVNCIRNAIVSFDAVTSEGTEPIHYSGTATFELEYQHEWWVVIMANFPGMS